uniref:receptor protein-tyrosine kinase n=1 Tax=Echeneis naucrates TaxID=173247 RepID=A0A665TAB3_ECHNA
CSFVSDVPAAPSILLNSVLQPKQAEVVLEAGSTFSLSCYGNKSIHWSSTAFRLHQDNLPNPVVVNSSVPRHTGTYRCRYSDQDLDHLETWIHLYVKDEADPNSVFVVPYGVLQAKQGQDFLFKCLLTDPSVRNLTLQAANRKQTLPKGMTVTLDPRTGALIQDLQTSFKGHYVCSGWKDGMQFRSKAVQLLVLPNCPPSLSVSQDEFVRLEGERFEVTCFTSNPSHLYYVTWTHLNIKTLNVSLSHHYVNDRLFINHTLTVPAVSLNHSGQYNCKATNEAGVAMGTTHLRVLQRPYLIIYLKPIQDANTNNKPTEIKGLFANVSNMPLEEHGEAGADIRSGSSDENTNVLNTKEADLIGASSENTTSSVTVQAYEGQDVKMTFVIEAYPPIRNQDWTTTTHTNNNNTVYQKSYTANGYRSEASLLLHRVRQEDRGRYSFHFSNLYFSGYRSVDLRIYGSTTAKVSWQNDTLICTSSGYPPPTILWYICPGVQDTCGNISTYLVANVTTQEEDVEEVIKHLPLSAGDDVTVECVAHNKMGESRDVFRPREPESFFTLPLIGALSAAAVLLLLLVVSYLWKRKPRYEIRWKIIESTDGNNYSFVDPVQLPYNQKWEFPRDKLRLGAVLGSGAFGKVVEATAYGLGREDNVTRVAVKMLKPSAHSEEREALMSELKILSHLGYHDNIVNLLGACTRGGPMLMITEYCSHGDLLNFLRAHAQDFMTSILTVDVVEEEVFYKNVAAQSSRLRSDSGISCCSEYQEMMTVLSPGQTQQGVQTDGLSVGDLVRFSYQVAQGLDFLSTRNCIHRDVAARNVLLTDHCVAKICDFGLARDICNDDSYIVQGNARLPVKWMAPESIFQCVYTVQSDVWSYGVLLWEIFSLGKSPYPNVAVDTNFYKMIKDGRHMAQPDFAPAEMYRLMTLCWSLEPTDRPTFKMIGQLVNRLFPSTSDSSTSNSQKRTYRNINEYREEEEEEEEEQRDGLGAVETLKREEQKELCDDEEEKEPMMKNIYQLS